MDEEATDSLNTNTDILPALNRAQDFGVEILAKHYEDPFIHKLDLPIVGGQEEYDIPESAYSGRIEKVEMNIPPKGFYEVHRMSYRDISFYESATNSSVAYGYAVVGNKIRFVPAPNGAFDARIWVFLAPEELVTPQGKITSISSSDNRIVVDLVGTDLTTETDNQNSFVNIVDGQTGLVKTTFQIKNISGTSVTFKSTPTRTTVENRTISTSITDELTSDSTSIEVDDYVCVSKGSCILYFGRPLANFIINRAVLELKMLKFGAPSDGILMLDDKFEKQVQGTWAGREQTLRIKKRSKNWGLPYRRYYNTNS